MNRFLWLLFCRKVAANESIPLSSNLLPKSAAIPIVSTPRNPDGPPPMTDKSEETEEPIQFAIPYTVSYDIHTDGLWEETETYEIWRLQVECPGATNVNLGLSGVVLPEGTNLFMYNVEETIVRRFDHVRPHGEFWTPVISGEVVILELNIPIYVSRDSVRLTIQSINSGFRSFGSVSSLNKSGSCNVDTACSQGDAWRNEISAVAAYSLGGTRFCTGALINNEQEDGIPYFLTAYHCGVNDDVMARSLVVYWNYETSECGKQIPDGDLSNYQIGGVFRAAYSNSDFTLLELDERPNEEWGIHYAGWDRSGSVTNGAIAIHHPQGDEKRISFENDVTTLTFYAGNSPSSSATHIRVADWDLGTTEQGSSGSPLFDENHRIIGQLHGGAAACGNNYPDWYGRLAVSWEGGGQANRRLKDWLDPSSTGATTVDTARILPTSPTLDPTVSSTTSNPSTIAPAAFAQTTTPTKSPSLASDDLDKDGCSVDVFWLFCQIGALLKAIIDIIVGLF